MNQDFRPHHARADLRGPVDGGFVAFAGFEQPKRPLGHCDLAKAFRDDDRRADVFRARHRHAQVVAQDGFQILIVHPAGNHGARANLDRLPHGITGHSRPADHDFAFHVGTQ
jgi:hypothetical protein